MKIERIQIGGIPVDTLTIDSLHELVINAVVENEKKIFLHANAHLIELANTSEKWLTEFFQREGNYVMCDGSGIQLAARLTNQKVPVKIPYNTWLWTFANFAASRNLKIYFLGADKYVIRRAVENLLTFEPGLTVSGFHHGYFDKGVNSSENNAIIETINKTESHVLFVGFGMPGQELWLKQNAARLNVRTIFTCGGAFDFIAGDKTVAPVIFRRLYLEWLFRLMLEPKRLLKRYTVGNLRFFAIVIRDAFRKMGKKGKTWHKMHP